MGKIEVKFLGSGDAFGSGGRLQSCIHIKSDHNQFFLDCGASVLPAIRRFDIDPNDIEAIMISHLHGDHFCGIPFFILDAQLISKRSKPLVILGPEGIMKRANEAMEVLFTGSSKVQQKFTLEYLELQPDSVQKYKEIVIKPFLAEHPSGAPSLALRIFIEGKTIAYTGDTEWTDNLISACEGADLLISEAFVYDRKIKYHMDYQSIYAKKEELGIKKLIVTHMGQEMLQRIKEVECDYAEDGKIFEI